MEKADFIHIFLPVNKMSILLLLFRYPYKLISLFKAAGPAYLYAPEVAMLRGYMNGAVAILVHFVQ